MPKAVRKPAYTLHKPSGKARVRLDGTDHYLGDYGSPESRDRYEKLVADWLAGKSLDACTMTVDDLVLRYLKFCATYYRTREGVDTGETTNVRGVLRYAVRECGEVRARDFGPLKLKVVRESMIQAGLSRGYINAAVGKIKRMFRWGVSEELIPETVYRALATVPGLRQGRSGAREKPPVLPVPEAFVDAVEPFVSRQVWAMIRLQLLTGARPGEIVLMRGADLNTQGKVWEFVPGRHKGQHHGRQRIVFLGPQAQAIVRGFLKPDLSAYLFSPADAQAERDAAKRAARKSKVQPSQVDRSKPGAKRRLGERYTRLGYANAIRRACLKADVPHWHPHQLRHNAATLLRRELGIETARTVLGHASADVTEIYALADMAKARDAAARLG